MILHAYSYEKLTIIASYHMSKALSEIELFEKGQGQLTRNDLMS